MLITATARTEKHWEIETEYEEQLNRMQIVLLDRNVSRNRETRINSHSRRLVFREKYSIFSISARPPF
eukprot:gene4512-8968_t